MESVTSRGDQSCLRISPQTTTASAYLEIRYGSYGSDESPYVTCGIETEVVLTGSLTKRDLLCFLRNAGHLRHPGALARLRVWPFGLIAMVSYLPTVEVAVLHPSSVCSGLVLTLTVAEEKHFVGRLAHLVAKMLHTPLCLSGTQSREYPPLRAMRRPGGGPRGAPSWDFRR